MASAPTLAPLSAVDAITPAFHRTKAQLFQPFRFGRWTRLALISLVAGEVSSSGGLGNGGNFNLPQSTGSGGGKDKFLSSVASADWTQWQDYLPLVVAAVLGGMVLLIILIYVSSIFRFILFDAVLTERVRIREGWRRWQYQGGRYFLWMMALDLISLALLGMLIGIPILFAWRRGMFTNPGDHWAAFLVGGLVILVVGGALMLAGVMVSFFTRDFVVPLMALEDVGATDAWRRLLPMLRAEQWSYAGYVGMKIVLAIGSSIVFGILNLIAVLLLVIPLLVLGVVFAVLVAALKLAWTPVTVVLAVLLGGLSLLGLMWALAGVSVPSAVFFQCYTLHFFGSRYPRLGAMLAPPAPPTPPEAVPAPA